MIFSYFFSKSEEVKTIIEKKFFDILRFSKIYLVTPLVTPIKTTENNYIKNQCVTYQIHFLPRHHLTKQSPAKLIAGFCFIQVSQGFIALSPLISNRF